MNITAILSLLVAFSNSTELVGKAATPRIEARIKTLGGEIEALQAERRAAAEANNEEFSRLKTEAASLRRLISTTRGAEAATLKASLSKNGDDFRALQSKQDAATQELSQQISQKQNSLNELYGLLNGRPLSKIAASKEDLQIAKYSAFLYNKIGDLFKSLTNPQHGGHGMPALQTGGFGGFGSAMKGDVIDPSLSDADKKTLFAAVNKCAKLGVRFDGARGAIWATLTDAAEAYLLIEGLNESDAAQAVA